jgi:hypothetical protein
MVWWLPTKICITWCYQTARRVAIDRNISKTEARYQNQTRIGRSIRFWILLFNRYILVDGSTCMSDVCYGAIT